MKNAVKMLFSLREITNDSIANSTTAEVENISQNLSDATWNSILGPNLAPYLRLLTFHKDRRAQDQANNTALYIQDIRRRYIRGSLGARFLKDPGNVGTWYTLPNSFDNEAGSIVNTIAASNSAFQYLVNAGGIAERLRQSRCCSSGERVYYNGLQEDFQNLNLQTLSGHHHALRYHYDTNTHNFNAMNTLNNAVANISNTSSSYLTRMNTLLFTNKQAQGMLNWISHNLQQRSRSGAPSVVIAGSGTADGLAELLRCRFHERSVAPFGRPAEEEHPASAGARWSTGADSPVELQSQGRPVRARAVGFCRSGGQRPLSGVGAHRRGWLPVHELRRHGAGTLGSSRRLEAHSQIPGAGT